MRSDSEDCAPHLRSWLGIGLGHVLVTVWSFQGAFFSGRLLFFRDVFSGYAPNYEVLARGFASGVWPLWNSACDAGAPFLFAYPVDLLLVLVGGSRAPLGWGAGLHLLLALLGASVLACRLGMRPAAAWCAGAVYGLCGFTFSLVNLLHLFQAAAWAPWVLAAWLAFLERPSGRRTAWLALAGALQMSTLGGEVVVQTAMAGLILVPDWGFLRDRRLAHLCGAAALAVLLTAPVWLGVRAVLENTARGHGFSVDESLGYSLPPMVLAEALVPKLLGDVHAFSDVDFWGEPYFPQGYPYILSLYFGFAVLVLAARAGLHGRLLAMAFLGVALSLGAHGPLGTLLARSLPMFRGPQKFFYLTALAVALLAGRGLDRARREPPARAHLALLLPGLLLVALALALAHRPDAVLGPASHWLTQLSDPAARASAVRLWADEWLSAGALALAAGLALVRGQRSATLAGGVAVLDLLIVNGALNPVAPPDFYALRPPMRAAVASAVAQGTFRWFSYGAGNTPGIHWEPWVALRRSDRGLYAAERQALWPRTHVFDGLDGAFDVDGAGWAPEGATLKAWEVAPARYREHHARLRLANIRWVLSFRPLPDDLVTVHARLKLDEIQDPLTLFELRDPLPRAFWVPSYELRARPELLKERLESPDWDARATVLLGSPPSAPLRGGSLPLEETRVLYEPLGPHGVRIEATSPPGFVVILDGYHPDWEAREGQNPAPILEADGRYRALWTPGGRHTWTLRYRPWWRGPALASSALGLFLCLLLLARGGRVRITPVSRLDTVEPAR